MGLHLVEGHKEHKAEILGGRSVNWQEGKDSKQGGMELVGVRYKLCEERQWNLYEV